jgi:hypothetical protein
MNGCGTTPREALTNFTDFIPSVVARNLNSMADHKLMRKYPHACLPPQDATNP